MIHRAKLTREEREMVSKIHKTISKPGLMRGNMVKMRRVCGKKNCICKEGKLHESWYVYQSKDGKTKIQYIPKEKEEEIKEWIKRYKEIKELIEGISEIYWGKISKDK